MNKEQAYNEAQKIFKQWADETEEISSKAKKEGIWKMGLDTNRELFKECDKKYIQMLEDLKNKLMNN